MVKAPIKKIKFKKNSKKRTNKKIKNKLKFQSGSDVIFANSARVKCFK